MSTRMIDGACFARMLLGGAALLASHAEELNAMNVFPVSDGDTGTNMSRTMEGGLSQLEDASGEALADVSGLFARGVLLAARGNSGVILSQIFAGINEGLSSCGEVSAAELARAYKKGIAKAYAAVQNPTEGTILTVFRESTEYAAEGLTEDSTAEDFFRLHVEEARRSLAATKELLPVLAEAGVVDSGAAGYLYIAEGMYGALSGEQTDFEPRRHREPGGAEVDIDRFTRDSRLEFGYCTEFLLRLTTAKVDPDTFDIKTVLDMLEELGGESVVAYKQDDIVKVHVHTFTPGAVLARAQEFGEFLTVKVENMSLGHSETAAAQPEKKKKYAVVAVAMGDGMAALFSQMGADRVIACSPSSNPSTEEFLEAFRACAAEEIIVLPNHKNIILAARQAAELFGASRVHVVESRSMMQGYSALSVITPGITDMEALAESARRAAQSVTDFEVTRAVRDASIDGKTVKSGDYIAISEGKIAACAGSAEDAVMDMLETLDADLCEIITLFAGKNVTAERRAGLTERLKESFGELEVTVYEGGQDVYDYYVAVE